MSWDVGDVILDLYEIRSLLGEGGMGQIHRVYHRGWDMELAVKSPRAEMFCDQETRDLFVAEAETWVNLALHPNVVSCYYVRTVDGIPRVFAELVEGCSLMEWGWNGRLYEGDALANVLDIAIQFARGLQHAHDQGLLHRDVKPTNVMLTTDGVAKVTDFGLSLSFTRRARGGLAADRTVTLQQAFDYICTPEYASPEQAKGASELSASADIWCWAVSVVQLFKDDIPTDGPSARAWLEASPPRVAIPAAVLDMLYACFEVDPTRRPADLLAASTVLVDAWESHTGQKYFRALPNAADLVSDGLNNRGASLWDLGRLDDARACFDESLRLHPGHVASIYNRGLLLWRLGQLTDVQLLAILKPFEGVAAPIREERGAFEPGPALACPQVAMVRLGPHGQTAATLSNDGSLRVWDVPRGRSRTLDTQTTVMAASADLGRLAAASVQGSIALWDASGRSFGTLPSQGGVQALAISEDGLWLVSAGTDQQVRLWDLAAGKLRVLGAHSSPVVAVHIESVVASIDSERIHVWGGSNWVREAQGLCAITVVDGMVVTGHVDGSVWFWSADSGDVLWGLQLHTGPVTALTRAGDGRLATAGRDGTVRLCEPRYSRCRRTLEGDGAWVLDVHATPDGLMLASASADGVVRVWPAPYGTVSAPAQVLRPKSSEAIHDSGGALRQAQAAAVEALAARDWQRARTAVLQARAVPGHERTPDNLALWQQVLALGGRGGLTTWWPLLQADRGCPQTAVALDIEGRIGFTGGDDREITVWDMVSGQPRATLGPLTGPVAGLAATGDGGGLVVTEADGRHAIWDVSGVCLRQSDPMGPLISLGRDGRFMAVGGLSDLSVLDTQSGTVLARAGAVVRSVWLSSDGRRVASGAQDGLIRLWDAHTMQAVSTLPGHVQAVRSLHGTPDGAWLASGGDDQKVRIWDVRKGQCVKVLAGHTRGVSALALSDDATVLVSVGKDKQVRVWDVRRGTCLATWQPGNDWVTAVALCSWGQTVLCATRDGRLNAQYLDWDAVPPERGPVNLEGFLAWYTSFADMAEALQTRGFTAEDLAHAHAWLARSGQGWVDPQELYDLLTQAVVRSR